LSKQRRSTREPEIAFASPRFIISNLGLVASHLKSPVCRMHPKEPRKTNITDPDQEKDSEEYFNNSSAVEKS
jgi:hypothetical protein